MSLRIHTAEASRLAVSLFDEDDERTAGIFDEDDVPDGPILAIEDTGCLEMFALVGEIDDFNRLGEDILARVNGADRWRNDLVQFARLLCEINATQSDLDLSALCESMDLELSEIDELFERAHVVWERAKGNR